MSTKVSIITISYNAKQVIGETINSVLAQKFNDYEYIFVDGKSSDGTVDTIRSYVELLENMGIVCRVISEPDKGIYDAMNKGIALANGQWVLMLNAGDMFAHDQVLECFFQNQEYDADIVYGDVIYKYDAGGTTYYKRGVPAPLDKIKEGMVFCHQCVFVRNEVIKRYEFDTRYKITADYDSFVRAYKDNVPFKYVNRVVAIYDCAGLSTSNIKKALTETMQIKKAAGFQWEVSAVSTLMFRGKNMLRVLIQKFFPEIAFSERRGWYKHIPENLN